VASVDGDERFDDFEFGEFVDHTSSGTNAMVAHHNEKNKTGDKKAYSYTFTVSTLEGELTCACLTSFDHIDSNSGSTENNGSPNPAFGIIVTSKHALPTRLRERAEQFYWQQRPELRDGNTKEKPASIPLPTIAQLGELALPVTMDEIEPNAQTRFKAARHASEGFLFSTLDLALPVVDFSMRVLFEHFTLGAILDLFRCVLLENRYINSTSTILNLERRKNCF
jgi:hypothetical protein